MEVDPALPRSVLCLLGTSLFAKILPVSYRAVAKGTDQSERLL
jgi:hypothetical protein